MAAKKSKQSDDYMVMIIFFALGAVLGGMVVHAFQHHDVGIVDAPDKMAHDSHDAHAQHMHEEYDVTGSSATPSVRIQLYPDTKEGVNVQLITTNFRFSPEVVNQEDVAGQGHAHVYVNGEKVGRVYSHWIHLADAKPGDEIKVTLNTDTHKDYVANGQIIQSVQLYAAGDADVVIEEDHVHDDSHEH